MKPELNQPASMDMTPDEFSRFQRFLKQNSGILLADNKQYLVKNRLTSVLRRLELQSVSELIRMLETGGNMRVRQMVVDAMTTNETFWFRDPKHFDVLMDNLLPELSQRKMGSVRIWSAACSSGQEPYSISLLVQQARQSGKLKSDVEILGTDISQGMLETAKRGTYSEIELGRGISPTLKTNYFQNVRDGWQLKDDIRRRVSFKYFNLQDRYQPLGKFDVIFCRNVLIYFSDSLKTEILQRMADVLVPGGYLFLSSTEALPVAVTQFEKVTISGTRLFKRASTT